MDNPETTIRATEIGPEVNAPEWALRRGWAIAERHLNNDATFQARALLAKDIAELLYNVASPTMGGRGLS